MFALLLGGSIWGYFKFAHYRYLTNAGHNHVTFRRQVNWSAYLEYGRRIRNNFNVSVPAMTHQNYEILRKYRRGGYHNQSDLFYAESQAYIDLLLESVTQLDTQQVPDVLERAHISLSKAHGLCYETMVELRLAHESEGAEKAMYLKSAQKKADEAFKTGNQGIADFKRLWDPTKN